MVFLRKDKKIRNINAKSFYRSTHCALRRTSVFLLIFSLLSAQNAHAVVYAKSARIQTKKVTYFVGSMFEKTGNEKKKYISFNGQRIAVIHTNPQTGEETISYIHNDHLSGTNVVTDADGQVKEVIEYDPFGQTTRHDQVANSNVSDQYFTGKPLDEETGLYFYGARYYNPKLGRFLTADSITPSLANPQAFNRYSYVYNNPLSYTDPTGHFPWLVFGAIFGALTAGISSYKNLGKVDFLQVAFGAITGGFSGYTIALAPSAQIGWGLNILKASAATSLASQGASAAGLNDLSKQLALGSQVLGGVYLGAHIGFGIGDWLREDRFGIFDITGNPATINTGDSIYTNGVGTSFDTAIDDAFFLDVNKVAYNPSTSFIADMTEVTLQKLTFTSSIDRQLANSISGVGGITLVGHSQGAVSVGNALLNLGLRGQSGVVKARFLASPLNQPRAYLSAAVGGLSYNSVVYKNLPLDLINIVGPNFNPVKFSGGLIGAISGSGLSEHSVYSYVEP